MYVFILHATSRLCYLVAVLCFLAAASPTVEAIGFRHEAFGYIPEPRLWWALMAGGAMALGCAAVFGALLRVTRDCSQIKRLLADR